MRKQPDAMTKLQCTKKRLLKCFLLVLDRDATNQMQCFKEHAYFGVWSAKPRDKCSDLRSA
eukprot:1158454-Pelagomonas_calceolata.AAC.11